MTGQSTNLQDNYLPNLLQDVVASRYITFQLFHKSSCNRRSNRKRNQASHTSTKHKYLTFSIMVFGILLNSVLELLSIEWQNCINPRLLPSIAPCENAMEAHVWSFKTTEDTDHRYNVNRNGIFYVIICRGWGFFWRLHILTENVNFITENIC